ncbi:hypothetical protein ACWDV4_21865 [Micromonospora sp. NPDC003197]
MVGPAPEGDRGELSGPGGAEDEELAALAVLAAWVRERVTPGDTITIPESCYSPGSGTLRMEVAAVGIVMRVGARAVVEVIGWEVSRFLRGRWTRRAFVHVDALQRPGAVSRALTAR